jgi:hypothetical protein
MKNYPGVNKTNSKCIPEYQELSKEFIENCKNLHFDPIHIPEYQELSKEFIEKYKNLLS